MNDWYKVDDKRPDESKEVMFISASGEKRIGTLSNKPYVRIRDYYSMEPGKNYLAFNADDGFTYAGSEWRNI